MKHDIQPAKSVVVCINAKMQKTKSGLEIANGENKPETGEVVAIGAGTRTVPFKIGDVIVFRRYTDNRIFVGGTEYNFVLFKDVLGIVKL